MIKHTEDQYIIHIDGLVFMTLDKGIYTYTVAVLLNKVAIEAYDKGYSDGYDDGKDDGYNT